MKITKPIIWFDIESTGVNTEEDRIVEIACLKINPDGSKETKVTLINPEISIPSEASEVHGITDEMVKNKPIFKQISSSLREWFKDCDLGGYNSNNYDVPLLSAELVRAGLEPINWNPNLFDAFQLYRHLFPNTLSDVYKRLTGEDLEGAHGALADIEATFKIAEILTKDLEQQTVEQIDLLLQGDKLRFDLAGKLYKDSEGVVRYAFGKDKDKSVKDEPGFARWMLNQSFPKETKDKLKEVLNPELELNKYSASNQDDLPKSKNN
jgi:DNA polymerase-3 subunit epsilon